jgi:hypothetical protein
MPHYVKRWLLAVRPFSHWITISTEPARRYSDGKIVENGWVDTVDDMSLYVYGPFDTETEAVEYIKSHWKVQRRTYDYKVLGERKRR